VQKAELAYDVYDVIVNEVNVHEVIVPTTRENLMIVPSTIQLAGAEIELTNQTHREQRLKQALTTIRDEYDYIFIDSDGWLLAKKEIEKDKKELEALYTDEGKEKLGREVYYLKHDDEEVFIIEYDTIN